MARPVKVSRARGSPRIKTGRGGEFGFQTLLPSAAAARSAASFHLLQQAIVTLPALLRRCSTSPWLTVVAPLGEAVVWVAGNHRRGSSFSARRWSGANSTGRSYTSRGWLPQRQQIVLRTSSKLYFYRRYYWFRM